MIYHIPVPLGYAQLNVVQLEMVNILVALKVWGHLWRDKKVKTYCDNGEVVSRLTLGKAKDSNLATCTRNIWLLCAMWQWCNGVIVVHIRGQDKNVVDLLSRWTYTEADVFKLNTMIQNSVWMNTHLDLLLVNHNI